MRKNEKMIQNKIKEVRQQKGISLYQLSKETGLSYRGLWNEDCGMWKKEVMLDYLPYIELLKHYVATYLI